MKTDPVVQTTFVGNIHPLTGMPQELWGGPVYGSVADQERQKDIVKTLHKHGACAKHRIVKLGSVTADMITRNLGYLISMGLVDTKIGPGVDGRGKITLYFLKEQNATRNSEH